MTLSLVSSASILGRTWIFASTSLLEASISCPWAGQAEQEEAQFWEKVDRGEASREDYYQQDFWLHFQGENQRKSTLLFGDASKRRFDSYEEAAAAMSRLASSVPDGQ